MTDLKQIRVPDLGDIDEVEVIEVLVSPGDRVDKDDGLITLESDKASMDVPAPEAGVVKELRVETGDMVSEGTVICTLEPAGEAAKTARVEKEEGVEGEASADDKPKESARAQEDEEAGTARPAKAEKATDETATGEAAGDASGRPDPSESDLHGEVVVLGSGPGGYTAAFRAADLGKKTVLIERYGTLGGVCLNVGCIPSKALLHAAKVIDDAADFADHGVSFGEPEIDLDALRDWKDGVVGRLTGGLSQLAKRRKIEVVRGTGKLLNRWQLEVETEDGETRTVGFDHLILAVGSRVIELPGLPWDDPRLMDSTAALELEEIPNRLLVVGGGIIGLELAGVYHSLGSEVSIVELTDGLMPGTDRALVKPLAKRIETRYKDIWLSSKVSEIKAQKQGLKVFFEGEDTPDSQVFDRVLVCVGRRPNSDRIGAEEAGIDLDDKGFVRVDREMRTNVPHIFAIGDLVGPPMLAHKASHQGKVAAEVAAGEPSAFDARAVPSVAYTDPEVAWVGPTEEELKKEGRSYGKGTFPWSASGRSLGMGRSEGMTKLLFEKGAVSNGAGRVIGGGVVGPHAGDLIAEITLAVEMGADAADLGLTVHPHPTLSETVAFAAEAFEGTLTELYKPKRK